MSIACLFGHKWHGCKCARCGKIRDGEHSWQNGKCIVCGAVNENVIRTESKQDEPVKRPIDYYALADQLAHYHTFSMDESEADKMEDNLLSGGSDALTAILTYLLHCGQGKQHQDWWNNAKRLVRLIRRFPNEDHNNILTQLVNFTSNIWEFQTQVKSIAEEELSALNMPVTDDKKQVVTQPGDTHTSPQKIDRKISEEMQEVFKNEKPLIEYKCKFYGLKMSVLQKGVLLGTSYFIPFADICAVVFLPMLEERPALGGCLKFVTKDNPAIPVRDSHSFHMPGQEDGMGGYLFSENCYWYNCGASNLCAAINGEIEKIKALVESMI